MKTPDTVIHHLRFALHCLPERNGHHDFEELCRSFARLRITSNILPATGPVSAGGDQGRDFETFRTYIRELGGHKFGGVGSHQPLAFACTLTAGKGLAAKVHADVAAIMAGVVRPIAIYFFLSERCETAKRHALQAWAQATHTVHLEIFDGHALAEQLASPDLFWIAARYLSVSPEILPTPQTADAYTEAKAKWLDQSVAHANYAGFIECKRAARRALDHSPEDVPRWIDTLTALESGFAGSVFQRSAAYEIIVLTMRLSHSLAGQEERIRRYLDGDLAAMYPDQVESVFVVTNYCWSARMFGGTTLEPDEIEQWFTAIAARIEAGLTTPESPHQRCLWLYLSSLVRLHRSFMDGQMPDPAHTFAPWLLLADECATSHYPVQEFHDDVLRYIDQFGDHPIFDRILTKLRPTIQKVAGSAALAESHDKRARQFIEQDKFVRAIRELHSAKIEWFNDQTMPQAVIACRMLSDCYCSLGLHYAGLYHALSAAFMTVNAADNDSLVLRTPECLFQAAEAAHRQGHACLSWKLNEAAMSLHYRMSPEPQHLDAHDDFREFYVHLPSTLLTAQRLAPALAGHMLKDLERWGLRAGLEKRTRQLEQASTKWTEAQHQENLQTGFTGPPFSDTDENCETLWSCYGLRFWVRWENNHEALRFAGEFVSTLQITLADLADVDLDIIPGMVRIDLKLVDAPSTKARQSASKEFHQWTVFIPRQTATNNDTVEASLKAALVCIFQIFRSLSVMPGKDFLRHAEQWAPRAADHAFTARRFPELIDFFLPREHLDLPARRMPGAVKPADWLPRESPQLPWRESIHPLFDEAEQLRMIQQRYDVSTAGLRYTLPGLLRQAGFRSAITALRQQGWKDWHILASALNTVVLYRVSQRTRRDIHPQRWIQEVQRELYDPDLPSKPAVPADLLTFESLEGGIFANLPAVLANLGLEIDPQGMKLEALRRYLRVRWRYFDLDVPHRNILAPEREPF